MILLLLAVTVSVQSQTIGEFIAQTVTLQLDAYEHSVKEGDEFKTHILVVDDFYDIHLIKSKINRLVNEYSDVNYLTAWSWLAEEGFYMCQVDFIDMMVMIGYNDEKNICMVLYDKKQGGKIVE